MRVVIRRGPEGEDREMLVGVTSIDILCEHEMGSPSTAIIQSDTTHVVTDAHSILVVEDEATP